MSKVLVSQDKLSRQPVEAQEVVERQRKVAAMPQVTEQQPERGGFDAESAEKCESCEGLTYGFPEAKWCCHCGAKLTGEYVPLLAALSAQGEDHE